MPMQTSKTAESVGIVHKRLRTREEIQKGVGGLAVQSAADRLLFALIEIELDIRDLLTEIRDKLDDVVDDRDRFHISTHPG